jgi:hypothetical protein
MQITEPNGERVNYEFNKVEQQISEETDEIERYVFNKIDNILYYDVILKRVPPFTNIKERQMQIFSEVLKTGVLPAEIAGKIMLSLSDLPNKEDLLLEMQNVMLEQQNAQAAMAQAVAEQTQVSPA